MTSALRPFLTLWRELALPWGCRHFSFLLLFPVCMTSAGPQSSAVSLGRVEGRGSDPEGTDLTGYPAHFCSHSDPAFPSLVSVPACPAPQELQSSFSEAASSMKPSWITQKNLSLLWAFLALLLVPLPAEFMLCPLVSIMNANSGKDS